MSVNAALFERENEPDFFARKCRRCKRPSGRCECERTAHDLDDDAVCACGFDAAEWWHLERMKAPPDREPQPICLQSSEAKR